MSRLNYTKDSAALMTSIPYLMISLISPFFGAMIDKIGKRMTFAIGSNIVSACSMIWAMSIQKSDDASWTGVMPLVLLGISNITIFNI